MWNSSDDKETEWLTIYDIEKLFREFLQIYRGHEDFGILSKTNFRRMQYLHFSSFSFSSIILKLLELRDYLYENLSLPINQNALTSEYEQYMKEYKATFIYPSHN